MTMEEAAAAWNGRNLLKETTYTGIWDYNKIQGCVCDKGYSGYDCSVKECPKGDDPMTTGQTGEVVQLACTCSATCSGTFTMSIFGKTTTSIAHDASATTLDTAIEALSSVYSGAVTVTLSSGSTVCGTSEVVTSITFAKQGGDLPPVKVASSIATTGATATLYILTVQTLSCQCTGTCSGSFAVHYDGQTTGEIAYGATATAVDTALEALSNIAAGTITVSFSGSAACEASANTMAVTFTGQSMGNLPAFALSNTLAGTLVVLSVATNDGTTEGEPCSNRGLCDYSTGYCSCFDNWESSDGAGGVGSHGDCGFATAKSSGWTGIDACPGIYTSAGVARSTTSLQNIYMTQTTVVGKSDSTGSTITSLVTGQSSATGIGLDTENNLLYWADQTAGKIKTATVAGASETDLVTGLTSPQAVALDKRNDYVFWTDSGTGKIQRASLAGASVTDIVTGLTTPNGLALDVNNALMYWVDAGTAKLQRATTAGASVTDIITSGLTTPYGVALDLVYGHIYWTDTGLDTVSYCNLDGSSITTIITSAFNPTGIALDLYNSKLYYLSQGSTTLISASLTGTFPSALTSGLTAPTGIVLDLGQASQSTDLYACNGHGSCSTSTWACSCAAGYIGGDCSQRACPFGRAWFDEASDTDTGHAMAECSNRGLCDRSTGKCSCQTGFEGNACDRMGCTCNGYGRCLDMYELSLLSASNGDLRGVTYGATPGKMATWDHNKVRGCHCDTMGYEGPSKEKLGDFTGYDCSLRTCPYGDVEGSTGVSEVQTVNCVGTSGSFTLTFRQQTTASISYAATATAVDTALEALTSIGTVTVAFSTGVAACASGGIDIAITFTTELGDLPPLTYTASGTTMTVTETTPGTRENLECSNQGLCDRSTGLCKCFTGYLSSDGQGATGNKGDCGVRENAWFSVQ